MPVETVEAEGGRMFRAQTREELRDIMEKRLAEAVEKNDLVGEYRWRMQLAMCVPVQDVLFNASGKHTVDVALQGIMDGAAVALAAVLGELIVRQVEPTDYARAMMHLQMIFCSAFSNSLSGVIMDAMAKRAEAEQGAAGNA